MTDTLYTETIESWLITLPPLVSNLFAGALLKRKHNSKGATWDAYTDVQQRYDTAVSKYVELGGILNTRMQRVFDLAQFRLKNGA